MRMKIKRYGKSIPISPAAAKAFRKIVKGWKAEATKELDKMVARAFSEGEKHVSRTVNSAKID